MDTIADVVKRDLPAAPELSFDRSDLERRIGFPAGRFTSAGWLLSPLVGVVVTVAFYAIVMPLPHGWFRDMFCERGYVQHTILLFSTWSGMILLVKWSKLRLQRRALRLRLLPEDDPGFVLTPASAEAVLARVHAAVDDPKRFLLTKRIANALGNLRNIGRIGDVDAVLSTEADNDEGVVESSYTFVRGLIWAIPVLGFIGTVQGLSQALAAFWGVVAHADNIGQLRPALQGVTSGLATAFETTLVGLIAALAIHLMVISLKRQEEQFLDDCKDYCQRHVVGRLRLAEIGKGTGT